MTDPNLFTAISRDARVRAALYLSVALSYLAAVRDDALALPMLAVFGGAALWSLFFEHRFLRPFFPAALKIGLIAAGAAAFLLFFVGGVARPAESFANAIARFLFWNATVFVLSRHKTEYDVWTLGIIDVSLFMIAGAFVQPPLFVPLFLGALTCMIYAFHRLALLRCGSASARATRGFGVLAVQVALVVEVAVVVFFLFPRGVFTARPGGADGAAAQAPPSAQPYPGRTVDRTGLPGPAHALPLESLARIKQDPSLALKMRVQALRPGSRWEEGAPLYIRGTVYDRYANGHWTSTARMREARADARGWIEVEPWTATPDELRQEILSAPTGGVALAIGDPIRIRGVSGATYDDAGTFFVKDDGEQVEYEVVSAWHADDAARSMRWATPAPIQALLALPPNLERLRREAHRVTEGYSSVVQKIERLRDWLHGQAGLEYRLSAFQATQGIDPVEHFLFEARHGYCMHFASALVLMCRALDIPARLATGFYAKDYDGRQEQYVVRQLDAHAWVEVPFAGRGWLRFDPTPADVTGASRPPEGPPVETGVGSSKTAAAPAVPARSWDQYILEYDPGAQTHALQGILRGIGSALGSALRWAAGPVHVGAMVAALAIALLVYRILPRERRARLRRMLAGLKERSSVAFYSDFLFLASRRGLHKPPGMTGREFEIVASRTLPGDAVALVTDAFYEVRYAGRALDADAAARVRDALRLIEAQAPPTASPATPP